ncbi:MAG TPA: helicase HerA-like domain-containing protein [Wenzhouxiangella sp.]|nr:helicase HerA-like domain-containing protein [Wenzhouxiangella sp.]
MNKILIGKNDSATVELDSRYGNRHGMIAGATGTGKSVSLMVMAEGFSRMGVPSVVADVKGDIAGMSQAADPPGEKLQKRFDTLGLTDWKPQANPVIFWDLYAELGHPLRTSLAAMGPSLLARVMELNDTQQGVLEIVFKVAGDNSWPMITLADLHAMLNYAADQRKEISSQYGLISTASIGAIQRALLRLREEDGDKFFGEPALELQDLMRQDMAGNGIVNILAADKLILKPRLYATFLLWLLSELFEKLPEVGDLDKPKLVFFFDEAHLLFDNCPPALERRVTQVVRLIRSKGVGVYFCSQNPDDVPGTILGQLGNRVQHALRSFTPRDQKAVRAAAQTFVPNPGLNVTEVIGQLGVGEALSSTLVEGGIPSPVERVLMTTPTCRLGTISAEERQLIMSRSPVGSRYDNPVEHETAAAILARLEEQNAAEQAQQAAQGKKPATGGDPGWGSTIKGAVKGTGRRQGALETMIKSVSSSIGRQIARTIMRGFTRR